MRWEQQLSRGTLLAGSRGGKAKGRSTNYRTRGVGRAEKKNNCSQSSSSSLRRTHGRSENQDGGTPHSSSTFVTDLGLGLLPLLLGFGKLDLRTPPTLLDNTPQSRTFSRTHARTIFHAQQISTQNSGQLPTSIQASIFIPSAYFLSMGGTSACCDEKIPLVKISTSSSPRSLIDHCFSSASSLRFLTFVFLNRSAKFSPIEAKIPDFCHLHQQNHTP